MELIGELLRPLGRVGVGIAVLHPVPVSIVVALAAFLILPRSGLWARHKRAILLILLALYAIDTSFALRRIAYAWTSPNAPAIEKTLPAPERIVLVMNVRCGVQCHDRLVSGVFEEVYLVRDPALSRPGTREKVRIRPGWSVPGLCPIDRQREMFDVSQALRQRGYCPVVEASEPPREGVFLVYEQFMVKSTSLAAPFEPSHLVMRPPGRMIEFFGLEVQRRSHDGTEVLASARSYAAPGLLGIPPLIGCWSRPENIIWTLPPGDTGCGLWRWFTSGGNKDAVVKHDWVFDRVFTPPARPHAESRPAERAPTPAEALDILWQVSGPENYLPALQEQLLSEAVSDEALATLVARLARRGNLEGSLLSFLAVKRPAAALAVPARIAKPAVNFRQPGSVINAMEQSAAIRDGLAELMFDSLASNWLPRDNTMERFLALMGSHDADWLCRRLDRLVQPDGIIEHRDKVILKNYRELKPPLLQPVLKEAYPRCGERAVLLLRALLAWPSDRRRDDVAELILRMPPEMSVALSDQAFANLIDEAAIFEDPEKRTDMQRYYVLVHLRVLRRAGQSCGDIAARMRAAIDETRRQRSALGSVLAERLALLEVKEGDRSHPCYANARQ
jgi:hypothetical protein